MESLRFPKGLGREAELLDLARAALVPLPWRGFSTARTASPVELEQKSQNSYTFV